jgi:hypothetical protein
MTLLYGISLAAPRSTKYCVSRGNIGIRVCLRVFVCQCVGVSGGAYRDVRYRGYFLIGVQMGSNVNRGMTATRRASGLGEELGKTVDVLLDD